jgi:hypothetical protein
MPVIGIINSMLSAVVLAAVGKLMEDTIDKNTSGARGHNFHIFSIDYCEWRPGDGNFYNAR